jgi:hypothetical protein
MTEHTVITLAEAPGVSPVFALETANPAVVIWPCPRCFNENGRITMYAHVAGGVCFKCAGYGGEDMPRDAAQKRAVRLIASRVRAAAKAEAKRLAKLAKRAERQAALLAEYPGLAELLDEAVTGGTRHAADGEEHDYEDFDFETDRYVRYVNVRPLGDFVYAQAERFRYTPEQMTPARCAAAVKAIADERAKIVAHAAKVAAAGQVPSGRMEITGTVVAVWEKEVYAGYSTTWVTKMRVETAEGWVGIGTAPAALFEAMRVEGNGTCDWRTLRGRAVRFVATVEPAAEQKEGELPVGWLARPSKAKLV